MTKTEEVLPSCLNGRTSILVTLTELTLEDVEHRFSYGILSLSLEVYEESMKIFSILNRYFSEKSMESYAEKKFHAFIALKRTYFRCFIKFHVYLICDRKSLIGLVHFQSLPYSKSVNNSSPNYLFYMKITIVFKLRFSYYGRKCLDYLKPMFKMA